MKIIVLRAIDSSRHSNCFVRGYIPSLFVSKPPLARTSLFRVFTETTREYNPVRRTFYDVNYMYGRIDDHASYVFIAILTVTSPIVINVPTRGLLAVETKNYFLLWLANLNIKRIAYKQ